jgi:predicted nucleic acid-binding Zn ribbon protein
MTSDDEIPAGKPPRSLAEVLGTVMRRMKMSDESAAIGVFSHWREIVGAPIADHVTPLRLEKRVLTVQVEDPAWATQLKFLESKLLSTLHEHIGDEIDSLKITLRRSRR